MTEAACYGLIWVAYTLLLYLHLSDLAPRPLDPAPPALPPAASIATGP